MTKDELKVYIENLPTGNEYKLSYFVDKSGLSNNSVRSVVSELRVAGKLEKHGDKRATVYRVN